MKNYILIVLLIVAFGEGYYIFSQGMQDSNLQEFSFVVEPQCEEELTEYFSIFNEIDGIEVNLVNSLNFKSPHSYARVNLIGIIKSSNDENLAPYVNGAVRLCGTNGARRINIHSEQEMDSFKRYLSEISIANPESPRLIELIGDELVLYQRYDVDL